jgi:hypothetical protein
MIYRTYDSWKAHNPADEELGSWPYYDDDELEPSDEELDRRSARRRSQRDNWDEIAPEAGTEPFVEDLRTPREENE